MKTRETNPRDYHLTFPRPTVVYNSVSFNAINAARAAEVRHIIVETDDGRPIAGLTLGRRSERFYAPFSAPFACLDTNRPHRTTAITDAVAAIGRTYPNLQLTLPPPIYAPNLTTTTHLALLGIGARQVYLDWNFHIDLTRPYAETLTAAARSTLSQARRQGFRLESSEPRRAYEIVAANHRHRNHPMRMTFEQVMATAGPDGPVKADFFVLADGLTDAAAAVVYHTAFSIAQVIYWGDLPGQPCRNAMNLLAAELVEHYSALGMEILDLGPASSEGILDSGLADFKSSIGCLCTPRPTLLLEQ